MRQFGSRDARAGRIREWLLLLLRFAITWDPKDEAAVFAMADEIDALGLRWRPSAPSFFRRTSSEVCKMITALDDPRRATTLKSTSRGSTIPDCGVLFTLLSTLRLTIGRVIAALQRQKVRGPSLR